jgi:hypothetical protein
MRLDTVENRSSQLNENHSDHSDNPSNQMTPARRAALDALEREFRDLLNAAPRH